MNITKTLKGGNPITNAFKRMKSRMQSRAQPVAPEILRAKQQKKSRMKTQKNFNNTPEGREARIARETAMSAYLSMIRLPNNSPVKKAYKEKEIRNREERQERINSVRRDYVEARRKLADLTSTRRSTTPPPPSSGSRTRSRQTKK